MSNELKEAAKQFYNLTIADPEVIIRPQTAEKQAAIVAAGQALAAALALPDAPPAKPTSPRIDLDFKQATILLEMFGGEPTEITLAYGEGHSGKGVYASYTEMPDEGAEFLGEPDDEAVPKPAAALPDAQQELAKTVYVEVRQCDHCGHIGINDQPANTAACIACEWSGLSPKEDKCPGCLEIGVMTGACPKCGSRTDLLADGEAALTFATSTARQPATAPEPVPWQPIETAPKDGKEVVLAVKSRAGIRHGVLVGHFMNGGHCIEDHAPINRGWYFWNGCMFDEASTPTHWMPLPHHPEWAKDGWQARKQGRP